ncbi:hypothetical protein HX813_11735 [Pseudomonas yamanorum]|uniref:hypothetical protein n=1 Tax=Pseudomonas yamanorum TaxID=515393 RepID=UPI0015A23A1B|nr:hypothetical protein [Pseudomonas yamanorum]NVZ88887.1 hypothetical protein [Pseudomonas yamanorum]
MNPSNASNAQKKGEDMGGSEDNPDEAMKRSLVPPSGDPVERNKAQADWNEKLLKEGETRILHRKLLFRSVAFVSCLLFIAFLYYLYWANNHPYRHVDHMVLWLLGVMPMGSIFILVKLSNEPAETNKPAALMWPEEAIKIGHKVVDVIADVVKDKLSPKSGNGG